MYNALELQVRMKFGVVTKVSTRYVHHSQTRPISYTFLVADYWSSTGTQSYKQLCQFGEVRT